MTRKAAAAAPQWPKTATPPALADLLRPAFSELKGRVVAVTETLTLQTDKPSDAILLCYTMGERVDSYTSGDLPREMVESVGVELWQPAAAFETATKGGRRIYKFHDHTAFRDRLLDALKAWHSPMGGRLRLTELSSDLLHNNATIAFVAKFQHRFRWCEYDNNTYTPIRLTLEATPAESCNAACQCKPDHPPCQTCQPATWSPTTPCP